MTKRSNAMRSAQTHQVFDKCFFEFNILNQVYVNVIGFRDGLVERILRSGSGRIKFTFSLNI